jgi:HD domain.
MSTKDEFIQIFSDNIHREGAAELLKWLESTDFFTAPASTRFHSCHEGGLCEHSLNVRKRLAEIYGHEVDEEYNANEAETIAICGLLHDVCKANFYTVQMRNVKNESGQWEKKPYYAIDEKFPFGHGEKSVFLIERFMTLTAEEAVAIRFHMGEFDTLRCTSDAYSKYPLAVMLHVADLSATYLDERNE